ncbi:MAG: hypothetical protein ACE5EQ_09550 [Phycisphaerae bacterium]
MEAGTGDITQLLVPPDDGAVARALADLELKLSTWTTAVADVQNQFRQKAIQFADAGAKQIQSIATDTVSADRLASEPIETKRPQGKPEKPADDQLKLSAAVVMEDINGSPLEDTASVNEIVGEPEKIEILRKAMSSDNPVEHASKTVATPEEKRVECPEPTKEEEALLAVLDQESSEAILEKYHKSGGEETIECLIAAHNDSLLAPLEPEAQKAIRVKYRMLLGRKSVKELIEQVESEPEQQSKSWWERVRG